MRAVVQRVSSAHVEAAGEVVGEIGPGLCVLLGVAATDTERDAARLAGRVASLRIFEDEAGRLARNVQDAGGAILAVSQFTLVADMRKGNRPSFTDAASPEAALPLYERFCEALSELGLEVARGRFGARMSVGIVNDGPATFVLDVATSA